MKDEDKYIKEKLDIANNIGDLDYTPPDRTEENRRIAAHFGVTVSAKKKKRRNFVIGFSTGGVAVTVAIIFIFVFLLKDIGGSFVNDADLISASYNITEFNDEFNVLLPDTEGFEVLSIDVYKHKDSGKSVYAKLLIKKAAGDKAELNIVFVDNYDVLNKTYYEELSRQGQASRFTYSYQIFTDEEVAYAKFSDGGYRYYLKLNSETPNIIINIIESFK